jgi:serine/threonine protein kinase
VHAVLLLLLLEVVKLRLLHEPAQLTAMLLLLQVLLEVARSIQYLHGMNIIHCDVKVGVTVGTLI